MALYKDLQNRIYDDMDGTAIHLLPVGTIPIAKADADLILNPPLTQAQIDQQASDKAKADLIALDLASIRAIREYIVSKVDAPQALKDKDALAVAARTKVKP